jgi:protein-tyrosine phosphatase
MNNILPLDFDEIIYLKLNQDLYKKKEENNDFDATNHYLTDGYFENRKYKVDLPDDFNGETYLKFNHDVIEKYESNPKIHYLNYGYFENRKYKYDISLPIDFNESTYMNLNTDIKEFKTLYPNFDLTNHYLLHGYYENRKYNLDLPYDFNDEIYLKLNPDIIEKHESNPKIHYLGIGYFENRKYKVELPYDFNDEIYLKLNPDIIEKYESNPKIHYLNFGYFENRKYKLDKVHKSILNFNEKEFVNLDNNYKNINITDLDLIKSFILIVDFPKFGGGTNVFLNTILKKYKYKQTFLVVRKINKFIEFTVNDDYVLNINFDESEAIEFLRENKNKILKIFCNHTLFHSNYFLNALFNLSNDITAITHDYYLISDNPQPYYEEIQNLEEIPFHKININKFNHIICQNEVTSSLFEKFIDKNKIIISPLPDFQKSLDIFDTDNSIIIIGVIGEVSTIKGKQIIEEINNYILINNINMKIIVFGHTIEENSNLEFHRYSNINELNNLLIKYKPNVILEASIWPETYSYTLSLSMISCLPIISLKKNYNSVVANRLLNYKKKYFFENIPEFIELVNNVQQNYFFTIEPTIYFNSFWDNYFITNKNKNKKNSSVFKYDIKPYFIYFPQFHFICENNTTFYPNFTDSENLHLLSQRDIVEDIETPFLSELNIESIHEYNLENKMLIQKHIDIINEYNIPGFAIYYYWFSTNTITNKNMIMDKVVNTFFDDSINIKNKKVFFIWANEDWSGNDAFGKTSEKIENKYTCENIKKNIDNLMTYFKHDNYLKIDNKPVFFIYHPWQINDNELETLYVILNNECKKNNFDGVNFILNNMVKNYDNYQQFAIHFNYKLSNYSYNKNQKVINFQDYLNKEENFKNCIQTIALDFDNRARLCKPNKLTKSGICIENTEVNKIFFINKIVEKYNKVKETEVENILLVNAFNEWGEKMTFEPSQEYGYYNLNLLVENL